MTTTNTFVGVGDAPRLSSRVLKPPGGGSSISFDDVDDFHNRSSPAAPIRQKSEESPKKSPTPSPEKKVQSEPKTEEKAALVQETPGNLKSPSVSSFPTPGTPEKVVTNGTAAPVVAASPATPPSPDFPAPVSTPATPPPASTAPVAPVVQEKVQAKTTEPAKEAPKIPNIEVPATPPPQTTTNGVSPRSTPSSTTPSSPRDNGWPTPEGSPNKSPDTKARLFGNPPSPSSTNGTPTRPVKDRMKSNIFSYEDEGFSSPRSNGSPVSAPEPKVTPSPVANAAPRQRVPPGGFSTKLW